MIEKISSIIAKYICNNMSANTIESKYEIIEYGIECIINITIPIVFFFCYSLICGSIFEMATWLTIFLIYRNHIGGYHASSHLKCILFSTVYGLLALYVIPWAIYIPFPHKTFFLLLCFTIHIFINPIIHHEENRNPTYLKQCRIKILITLLISCLLIILFNRLMTPISNAIFIGIISAEFLYIIALPNHLLNNKQIIHK